MIEYVLSLDPGETTGWSLSAVSDTEPLIFLDGGQIEGGLVGVINFINAAMMPSALSGGSRLRQLFQYPELYTFHIVSESFVLDGRTRQPNVTPLRIEGALTALLGDGVVHYQRNSYKGRVGDSKLREIGFWIPGQRHQMDARLHALAYMKTRHLPTAQAYWPEDTEE